MRMLVLGAGLQGSACAYDLLQNPAVTQVRLADIHVEHLPPFLAPFSGARLIPTHLDVRDRAAVLALMRECDAVMSAIPYYFNGPLAAMAVEAGVHFCDLGGNTEIVEEQKRLHDAAAARGVTIVPDCGLAPGMVNILAQQCIEKLDAAVANSVVAFEADQIDVDRRDGWSVVVVGQARVIDDPERIALLDALDLQCWLVGDRSNYVAVRPELVSGRVLVPAELSVPAEC